jgi:sulfite reductase subunit B
MKNPYLPIEATIDKVVEESPTIKTFLLTPKEPVPFKTGQFIEVTVPGIGEGPFTPSSDPNIAEKMEVTIMNVGKVTSTLHSMRPGQKIGVRGPYGKGYPLDDFRGKEIFIVGGGVGLAPLRSLLFGLFGRQKDFKKIYLRYGARTPNDIIYKEQIPDWGKKHHLDVVLTVDKAMNGWKGNIGVVTTILNEIPCDLKNTTAIVCGPPIMMKFTTFKLLEKGFAPKDIYLSMEKNMSCGIGKCGHCGIGHYYVCKDGPVFTYDQVKDMRAIWD